jgi:hypothetical protein
MKTKTAIDNGGETDRFTNHGQINIEGRGRGLVCVENVLARAQVEASKFPAGVDWGAGRPLVRGELVKAWYAGESDAMGLAAAAAAEQTVEDVRLVTNCLRALVRHIEDKGGNVRQATQEEARAAGLCALVQWRNGVLACPAIPGKRVVDGAAVVAWRAVSDEISKDDMGHSVELSSVSDEWLAAAVEPLAVACCAGFESRSDKAARWLRQRGAARRKAALPAQMDRLRHGHGRHRALVDRVEAAAARLIGGDSIDAAARAVGFKDRWLGGTIKEAAGVQLARAARACGLVFNLIQPRNGATAADEFNPYHRPLAIALN